MSNRAPTSMETNRTITQISKRRSKILEALKSCDTTTLTSIPNRIAMRCIRVAKTAEAKERLVFVAVLTAVEDLGRIWAGQIKSFPKRIPKPLPPKNVYAGTMAREADWWAKHPILAKLFEGLFR